jgi:hypothetical protein
VEGLDKRKLCIGAVIGIFVFAVYGSINKNIWNSLETELLNLQSLFKFDSTIFNSKNDFTVINLTVDTKTDFNKQFVDDREKRDFIFGLVDKLISYYKVSDATVALNQLSQERIDELDVELNLSQRNSFILFVNPNDINFEQERDHKIFWLSRQAHKIRNIAMTEFLQGKVPESLFSGKKLILGINLKKHRDLNLLVNYFENRWIAYLRIHSFFVFLTCILMSLAFAVVAHRARIIVFSLFNASLLTIGQVAFSFFNTHIEIMPLIVSSAIILLVSGFFDLDFKSLDLQEFLVNNSSVSEEIPAAPPERVKEEPLNESSIEIDKIKELRSKFYCEQETNLEEIALDFEERALRPFTDLRERLDEVLEMSNRESVSGFNMIKYDFDRIINELDAFLFSLVPLRFEDDRGLIDPLAILTSKFQQLNKGQLRTSINSLLPLVKLDLDLKINTYRIIERILQLIQEQNSPIREFRPINISIDIRAKGENKEFINFDISYEGKAINRDMDNYKLRDIYKRAACINADINFGSDFLNSVPDSFINKVELTVKSGSYSLDYLRLS